MTHNQLSGETSPYLLQHRNNPVHWRPWGKEAFAQAQHEGKPVLLSIGYAACHWCHVMAHESFENSTIAELMNNGFINIKVDREERPDVDKIYMDALHSLGEQGGWPLTMFLTPDGRPFWGGTYFPPESRYGRPGFRHVLSEISRIWQSEPEKVESNAAAIRAALSQGSNQESQPAELSVQFLAQAANFIMGHIDHEHGGLRGAPKFPQTSTFEFLWSMYLHTRDEEFKQAVETTLINICQGGIYDHLAGGFARYSVDQLWLAPHFEKMLYDNAQLVGLMAKVAHSTANQLFRLRIEETVNWLISDMTTASGAFAASYDADTEGEEGKFYVWSEDEIDALLKPDSAAEFKSVYDVSAAGNWEGKNILNRLQSLELSDAGAEQRLADARNILLDARASRIPPGLDDKVLADWNGLMITALATAGVRMSKDAWFDTAAKAFTAVLDHLWDGSILHHSYRDGRTHNYATADDYANMIAAAIALYQSSGDRAYVVTAESLTASIIKYHWDTDAGGLFYPSALAENLIVRTKYPHDDATPNANATMLAALANLHLLTGNPEYQEYAGNLHDAFAAVVQRSPSAHASFLTAFYHFAEPAQAVIIGSPEDDAFRILRTAVLKYHDALIIPVNDPADLPNDHVASSKTMINDVPTLYLCTGQKCSLPVTDPEQIRSITNDA